MDNMKPQFNPMGSDDGNSWRTPNFRQNMVAKIEEVVQRSGVSIARNPTEMENHVFTKAKSREEYVGMIAKLILHFRERDQQKPNQGGGNMQGPNQQQNPNMQNQPGQAPQGPNNQGGLQPDPINALQNLASQGSRNQMMNMGPQGQMSQQGVMGPNPGMGPNQMGMQGQMGQQPMTSQAPQPTASNLLQTLNQRPQLNMQMQKLGGAMGMVSNQGQMGNNMMGGMNPMGSQLQNQLNAPMQGMTMGSMAMGNMQGPMGGANAMGGPMQCNQVGMGGQMAPGGMQGQMGGQMVGGMGGNQMMNMPMMHMSRMQKPEMLSAGYGGPRGPQPGQYLRQSPSPSAPSPGMSGPSPASMNMMGGAMASPMSQGLSGMCGAGVGSPSSQQHMGHPQQRPVGMGMVASPSSSLNTPGGASPGGEEAAYREKVRQLSKYIEPLRRMVHRMVSEGENIEKLTKMKNLLDILSNPNKRVPLETLIKCEVVLEKLDFKRSEGVSLIPSGKEQIFNPLLEVVNNCLQTPNANHTLKRTFGSALDALNGPEIKSLPPPQKVPKLEEESTIDIPDVLQGEIARLDSRFKVSLETNQLSGSNGEISLIATLDDSRLPCVPPVRVSVPRDYPAQATKLHVRSTKPAGDTFLARVETSLLARTARLPKNCSLGQLLDAWEMSVRQACAPTPSAYTPVPALGL